MFKTKDGEEIFIIDGHVHNWDASPENIKNIHGKQFIDCFYGYHASLSPPEQLWTPEKFAKYGAEQMVKDLFIDGPDDIAIMNPTYLKDFYKNGFNTIEQNAVLKTRYPDRFILNGAFDPRDGEGGLEALHAQSEIYKIQGVKLYTAEWKGNSRGYKLSDPEAYKYFELCEKLGIKNVHVHKGPTIIPLDRDAFDVADIDHCATDFPNLNFIVEHCGLPRLDDFCWIAVQESNVYGGLAVVLPFIHSRPGYFAKVMSELLFWLGEDKILFGSDYGIWTPQWLVEKFMAFELPDELVQETGKQLTLQAKKKILGENAARLYNVDIAAHKAKHSRARATGGMTLENQARIDEVRAALDRVTDPELDESVVALNFLTAIDVSNDGAVAVKFRLPTYWCAANFSYLMASDMRDAVAALPWVTSISVTLDEHMFVDEINNGVAGNKDFPDAFPAEAAMDLSSTRLNFGLKSFERRQEALLRHLLAQGHKPETILELTTEALPRLTLNEDGAALRTRYLERRPLAGDMPLAFVSRDGVPIATDSLTLYLRNIRRVGLNAEFNGALCRGLLAARYGDTPHELPPEPELIDFIKRAATAVT